MNINHDTLQNRDLHFSDIFTGPRCIIIELPDQEGWIPAYGEEAMDEGGTVGPARGVKIFLDGSVLVDRRAARAAFSTKLRPVPQTTEVTLTVPQGTSKEDIRKALEGLQGVEVE